jgi:hypothetical protein
MSGGHAPEMQTRPSFKHKSLFLLMNCHQQNNFVMRNLKPQVFPFSTIFHAHLGQTPFALSPGKVISTEGDQPATMRSLRAHWAALNEWKKTKQVDESKVSLSGTMLQVG